MDGFSGQGILAHGRNHYQGGSRRHVDLDRAGAGARGELVECRGGGGVSCLEFFLYGGGCAHLISGWVRLEWVGFKPRRYGECAMV